MSEENPKRSESISVSVRMPGDLDQKINTAASKLNLSKQDTMRLSLERGLLVLEAQLTSRPEMAA